MRRQSAAISTLSYHSSRLKLALRSGKSIDIPAVPLPDRSRPVHPAQLYSAIDAGLLGWLLWAYFPFRRRDGEVHRAVADDSPDHALSAGDHSHR